MKSGLNWLIVDTETDGLYDPIHVVELSAQLMSGWQAVGEPFQMLLNHNVPIPSEAVAIHGYTQEYLAQHGHDPLEVYSAFRDYARDYPLVAHNLSYDWNRCLEPEWARLGVPIIGRRGFCSMMLARRLVKEASSYRLAALKECFRLSQSQSHRAKNDVLTVRELFENVYRPRLLSAGLESFEDVAAFAKRTPVAKCLSLITSGLVVPVPPVPQDAWYYIDSANNAHGPLSARDVSIRADLPAYHVWREGMPDWISNQTCAEFQALAHSQATPPPARRVLNPTKTIDELIGLCKGLISDDKITTAEVQFLSSWLEDFGPKAEWPASQIAETLERVLEDGKITKAEKEELKLLLHEITGSSPPMRIELIQSPSATSPRGNDLYTIVPLVTGSNQ